MARTCRRTGARRACSKRGCSPSYRCTKGGLNSKLHAVCDGAGKPIILLLSEGQMSDHKGARLVLGALLVGSTLIADRGYDSNWFREVPAEGGHQALGSAAPETQGADCL